MAVLKAILLGFAFFSWGQLEQSHSSIFSATIGSTIRELEVSESAQEIHTAGSQAFLMTFAVWALAQAGGSLVFNNGDEG